MGAYARSALQGPARARDRRLAGDDRGRRHAPGRCRGAGCRPRNGRLAGFVEIGSRSYAEGCESAPVAYLEGWYVDPDARRSVLGRRLVEAAEDWARANGFTELASDAELDNEVSHRAHWALGFDEVERQACFRKRLA